MSFEKGFVKMEKLKFRSSWKFVAALFAALCLAFAALLSGCSSSSNDSGTSDSSSSSSSSTTSSSSDDKQKLIVGFDQAYPPYGFLDDNGQFTGFDLDLAEAVCGDLGWECEYKAIDWDSKDALLEQGQINCIWNGFTMEGREGKYAFSEPYMLNEQVIVVKAGSDIKDFAGLADKTVITQADSAALEVLEGDQKSVADTFKTLDTISDYNNAFMQLESGAVDAVACDLSIAQYQMSANPDKYVKLDEALSSENYAVGFKNDEEGKEMASKVTESLKKLNELGIVKETCQKYESYGLSYDNWELK